MSYGGAAYGGVAYGGQPQQGGAFDLVTFSDAATVGLWRRASDAFSVSDSASAIWGFDPNGFDSWPISDSASTPIVGRPRTASDHVVIGDSARGIHVPYIDLPSHLVLKSDGSMFTLQPDDAMSLSPEPHQLVLQPGDSCTIKDEPRGLDIKDEPRGVWVDG